MSGLGTRTKKVTVYGRKKAQIISIHNDFSPAKPLSKDASLSPSPPPATRPPLRSKLSSDASNIPPTPSLPRTGKVTGKALLSTPDFFEPEVIVLKPRKVTRPGKKVIPRKSVSPATPEQTKSSKTKLKKSPREVFDGVVIPISSSKAIRDISVDLSDQLANITLSGDQVDSNSTTADLQLLVESCSSTSTDSFDGFFESSTFLQVVFGVRSGPAVVHKIGEASYSEVFAVNVNGCDEVVVKVIPLLCEGIVTSVENREQPDCSSPADVLRELEVTKRMTNTPGGGFARFIGAFNVEGTYPAKLLSAWDEYKFTLGSASVRPDSFSAKQQYALVVLSHGGPDLEMFQFDRITGWMQAASVFWQVVDALSRAEDWTKFEHRDLHEGQILITSCSPNGESSTSALDPAYSGVRATIIDFGLSRLDMPDRTAWTPLPEELYDSIGDQWDVYRSMKDQIAEDWSGYHPVTNVMWLHYLIRYLLHSCGLRKPSGSAKSTNSALRPSRGQAKTKVENLKKEHATKAWEELVKVEAGLRTSLNMGKKVRGKSAERTRTFECAGDVLIWGQKEAWVEV
ncbi:hypothetical protein BCR39DRAFT_82627 [Naematelia encephala]|uniref:non-specific serine/threonine protein kinase n=1 Tax=Naematelia encephala TaxID=71784 RepID=A0A1Y2BBD3_9TREE|nr:hypothetical protein BCR39DRAFT_82627 [Naematelia encephala]